MAILLLAAKWYFSLIGVFLVWFATYHLITGEPICEDWSDKDVTI